MKPGVSLISIAALAVVLLIVASITDAFQNSVPLLFYCRQRTHHGTSIITTLQNQRSDNNSNSKGNDSSPKADNSNNNNILDDIKGMLKNFDDVVDDFVYKRMGAGEQWYGKRKYNPSGRVDGDYNGMGRSDYFRIEIARVQKEEMELRKRRRLEEEEARKRGK
jgi:hypothetical protein